MPNSENSHRNKAKTHLQHAFYYENHGDWPSKVAAHFEAVKEMNLIPAEELTDYDYWMQSRNYIRLAEDFKKMGDIDAAADACFMATEWLRPCISKMKPDQMLAFANIFQHLKSLAHHDRFEYRFLWAVTEMFSKPEFDAREIFEALANNIRDLDKTNPAFTRKFVLQLTELALDAHKYNLLPNESMKQILDDLIACNRIVNVELGLKINSALDRSRGVSKTMHLDAWFALDGIDRGVKLCSMKPSQQLSRSYEINASAGHLLDSNAGVTTRSRKRALEAEQACDEIKEQPNKRPPQR